MTTIVRLDELQSFHRWGRAQTRPRFSFCDDCADWHWSRVRTDLWNVRLSKQDRERIGRCVEAHDEATREIARVMHMRWGPQGERIDINGGKKHRVHLDPAEDDSEPIGEDGARGRGRGAWREEVSLGSDSHVAEDFLRERSGHGWKLQSFSSGKPTGRPRGKRKGATGVELIQQLLEDRLSCPLETATSTLSRGRKAKTERRLYDELAEVVAELVSAHKVNRTALAGVLKCSRPTIDRLVRHSTSNCTVKVASNEEPFSA